MFKPLISTLLFFTLSFASLFAAEKISSKTKWQKLLGQWQISNSTVVENRAWASPWEYYELLKYNTIITTTSYNDYSSLEVKSKLFDRYESPSEFLISFAVTSESQSWFYHMYAFKFTGGYWGIDKVSLVFSDQLDKTKSQNTKNNSFIKELATSKCKIKYDKTYNYRIVFERSDIILYVNDEKVLSAPFPEKSYNGRVAISSKNVKISVDKVEIKQYNKVIFEDDFNEDSLYTRVLKVTSESTPKNETEKKPE